MSKKIRIYHNPACSKSRSTMKILTDNKADISIVEYLRHPPDSEELDKVLNLLNIQPRELMRKHEKPYTENNLDDPELSRKQLIQAMIDNPILIERPIVISGGTAIIGRPPEKVLEIL